MLDQTPVGEQEDDNEFDAVAHKRRRAALDSPPKMPLGSAIRAAQQETGSGTAWLSGFWKSVSGPGKLTAAEYFYYRLYRAELPDDALARYVGKDVQSKMHRACCDEHWFAPASDKLFFLAAMRGAGIPVPETLAVFDPTGRRAHPNLITCADELSAFLDQPGSYPLFAKPIDGMYSVGAMAMTDGGDGWVHVRGAGNVRIGQIVDYVRAMSAEGYLLQRMLVPDRRLLESFGGTLASVRFLVLVGDDGPVVESAVVKIPRAENIADNYWRHGNMLGAVDVDSGTVVRVVTGTGPALQCITEHPETGRGLIGMRLPDWDAARAMAVRAAGALPGLRTQSWDVAMTSNGPVALEVNWGGDLNLHQLAHGRGALTPAFVRHLRRNGYKGKLPADY